MSHTVTGGDINDDPANHLLCECRGTSENGDYMLLCSLFDTWDYCPPAIDDPDEEEPVCASILFGQTFNDAGMVTERFRNYDYVDERMGTITVQRYDTTQDCVVTVDAEQCTSCDIIDTCPPMNNQVEQTLYESNLPTSEQLGIFTDLKVNCTNVNARATFECGIADGAGNLLNILNGNPISPDDSISTTRPPQQTIDPNAFPPTVTPVEGAPTPAPSVSLAPSVSRPPSGVPTTAPSLSLAPSVSTPPSGAPTLTARPTMTAPPTALPLDSMTPTVAKLSVAADTTRSAAATTATSVIVSFFSSLLASFLLLMAQ